MAINVKYLKERFPKNTIGIHNKIVKKKYDYMHVEHIFKHIY